MNSATALLIHWTQTHKVSLPIMGIAIPQVRESRIKVDPIFVEFTMVHLNSKPLTFFYILKVHKPNNMNQTAIRNFKRDYHRCGRYNLHVQVPHLGRLADFYKDKYGNTKHWTDCLKVGIFLHNINIGFKILTNTCKNYYY